MNPSQALLLFSHTLVSIRLAILAHGADRGAMPINAASQQTIEAGMGRSWWEQRICLRNRCGKV